VDTSAWIAFFSARDQNHAEAERLFREAVLRNVILTTTNLVLAEIHRLILHRGGVAPAALALNRIGSSPRTSIVFATAGHHSTALEWIARFDGHQITYTDAVSFAVNQAAGCVGFLSFDSHFLQAGFSPWLPSQAPKREDL
jgi:predicted nucleic acid-binding protein